MTIELIKIMLIPLAIPVIGGLWYSLYRLNLPNTNSAKWFRWTMVMWVITGIYASIIFTI